MGLSVKAHQKRPSGMAGQQLSPSTNEKQVELEVDIDRDLLADVVATVFNAKANPHLYQEYKSESDARQVEEDTAKVIVSAYRHIKANAASSVVRALNASYNK